jgi:ATP synthase protein I
MSDPTSDPSNRDGRFAGHICAKEQRKLRAQQRGAQGVWFGFGMMGLVGWSIVVPTLAGAALGAWLDTRFPSVHSWTLTLLIIGLIAGCANAWRWIAKEDRAIRDEQAHDDD